MWCLNPRMVWGNCWLKLVMCCRVHSASVSVQMCGHLGPPKACALLLQAHLGPHPHNLYHHHFQCLHQNLTILQYLILPTTLETRHLYSWLRITLVPPPSSKTYQKALKTKDWTESQNFEEGWRKRIDLISWPDNLPISPRASSSRKRYS